MVTVGKTLIDALIDEASDCGGILLNTIGWIIFQSVLAKQSCSIASASYDLLSIE
jgi:hypothetical protein